LKAPAAGEELHGDMLMQATQIPAREEPLSGRQEEGRDDEVGAEAVFQQGEGCQQAPRLEASQTATQTATPAATTSATAGAVAGSCASRNDDATAGVSCAAAALASCADDEDAPAPATDVESGASAATPVLVIMGAAANEHHDDDETVDGAQRLCALSLRLEDAKASTCGDVGADDTSFGEEPKVPCRLAKRSKCMEANWGHLRRVRCSLW